MFGFGKRSAARAPAGSKRRRMVGTGKLALRNFMAAEPTRLTGSVAAPQPSDSIVKRNQRALVGRSREQAASNDYMIAFLRMVRLNVVGPRGVLLQSTARNADGSLDTSANDAVEAAFATWGRMANCAVDGRSTWRSVQRDLVLSMAKDGEALVRLVYGADAGPYGFAVQPLDPQIMPVDLEDNRLPGGAFIRHGIEFNRVGRPVAYYLQTDDPGSVGYTWGGRDFERVPADLIVHAFDPVMIGQKRGLPWAATSLWRMQMLGGFEQAALVNARVGASKGGFLQWREGWEPDDKDGDGGADRDVDLAVEPGQWTELAPGLEAKSVDPQYPAGEFAVFVKSMLRGVSAGMGVAYNSLARDLEGVNLSSIRHGTLEERQGWMDLQELFIEAILQPIFAAWLRYALLSGRIRTANGTAIPAARFDKLSAPTWQARRWDWIDPLKEVNANVTARDNLLVSPGQLIRERGHDPDSVWRETARDIEGMRTAGIPEKFIAAAINSKIGTQYVQGNDGEGSPDDED